MFSCVSSLHIPLGWVGSLRARGRHLHHSGPEHLLAKTGKLAFLRRNTVLEKCTTRLADMTPGGGNGVKSQHLTFL